MASTEAMVDLPPARRRVRPLRRAARLAVAGLAAAGALLAGAWDDGQPVAAQPSAETVLASPAPAASSPAPAGAGPAAAAASVPVTVAAARDMMVGRYQHTATLLRDGRVLVAGGVAAGGRRTAEAELFDPATGAWTVAAPM